MKQSKPSLKNRGKPFWKKLSVQTETELNLLRRQTAAKIVIDAYAWIEHFIGSAKGCRVNEILEDADEVYTPDTVLAEIARKYIREGVDPKIVDQRLNEIVEASTIICIDAKLAANAAKSCLEMEANAKKLKLNRPSLLDAIVLSIGRSLKSKILTGDQHFKNLPETIWIE
jgi:predicted nucleic acid-binding protein